MIGALRPGQRQARVHPGRGTRRWRRSWPAPTPSSPARSASAWRPPARRDPPAERPLRRQARPPAGGGDRRPAGAPALGGNYQQEVDLPSLFKDVATSTSQWRPSPRSPPCGRPRHPDRRVRAHRHLHHPAQRRAGDGSGGDTAARQHGTIHSGAGTAPRVLPADARLRRAAEVLNAGEKVAMLVGAGALRATDEVIEVADSRRGRRQGAAGQGGGARRPAIRDRLDRAARHPSELGHDAGLRHPVGSGRRDAERRDRPASASIRITCCSRAVSSISSAMRMSVRTYGSSRSPGFAGRSPTRQRPSTTSSARTTSTRAATRTGFRGSSATRSASPRSRSPRASPGTSSASTAPTGPSTAPSSAPATRCRGC